MVSTRRLPRSERPGPDHSLSTPASAQVNRLSEDFARALGGSGRSPPPPSSSSTMSGAGGHDQHPPPAAPGNGSLAACAHAGRSTQGEAEAPGGEGHGAVALRPDTPRAGGAFPSSGE